MACVICGVSPTDTDHIKTRGAGGGDEPFNTWRLCRRHHSERHQMGWGRFIAKYPQAGRTLEEKGWLLKTQFGLERLVRGKNEGDRVHSE